MSEDTDQPIARERTIRFCLWLSFVGCWAIITLTAFSHFSGDPAFDDAYMFVRYADNLLTDGTFAWNPQGEPTYGLTAVLYLTVIVPMRLLTDNPALTVLFSSLLCGLVFLVLLTILLLKYSDAGPLGRRFLLVLVFFWLAIAVRYMYAHFVSGMDTTFALAYLTAYILLAKWHERAPSVGKAVCVGVWGGLAYFARPDLMLYAAVVPVWLLLFGGSARVRRHALLIGTVSLLTLFAQMGFARLFFASALPLPFYAKGREIYGAHIREMYRLKGLYQFGWYALTYWFLFVMVGVGVFVRDKGGLRRTSAVDRGLFVASVLFILYHLFFVMHIMGINQRFYYPTLPALAFLAAQGAAVAVRRYEPSIGKGLWKVPKPLWCLATLLLLYALLPQSRSAARMFVNALRRGELGRCQVLSRHEVYGGTNWFALEEFSALPDDLVIATTEVGRPGVMNPKKCIIDLAGLNEPEFIHKGFSADRLFEKYNPDLIYMPHSHYREMIDEILTHPHFRKNYELFSEAELTSHAGIHIGLGVALRRDSRHYAAMRKLMPQATRPQQKP